MAFTLPFRLTCVLTACCFESSHDNRVIRLTDGKLYFLVKLFNTLEMQHANMSTGKAILSIVIAESRLVITDTRAKRVKPRPVVSVYYKEIYCLSIVKTDRK